jgi:opacity protein-like surface antigen
MKKIVFLALAFAGAVAVSGAHAQQASSTGWYGQFSAGYLQFQDNTGSINGTSVKSEYDDGFAISAAAGYAFGNGFRAELEGGYGKTGYDTVTVGSTRVSVNADIDLWSVYAAGYYDFNLAGVKPYVGAGLGFVYASMDNFTATSGGTSFSGSGGNETNVSAFGEAGIAIALNDRMDLVPGVRYLWLDNSGAGQDDDTAWLFKVGLRYKF